MYNHNKAQQSKNRVHISWDILYVKQSCNDYCEREIYNVHPLNYCGNVGFHQKSTTNGSDVAIKLTMFHANRQFLIKEQKLYLWTYGSPVVTCVWWLKGYLP